MALLLTVMAGACTDTTQPRQSTGLPAPVSSMPSPTAANTPRPGEEQTVVGALANAGLRLSFVGASKFDWILGDAARRSGIFTGTIDGVLVRADVLFLDAPASDVTVCTDRRSGETEFTVRVAGRTHSASPVTGAAMGPLYFAMSDRFFVMSTDARVRDALRDALGLSEPRC